MKKEELLIQLSKMQESLENLKNSNNYLKETMNKNAKVDSTEENDSELTSISDDITKMINSIHQDVIPYIQEKMED